MSEATLEKDYVVQIRIKNGPMLRAMRAAGFETAKALSDASGVQQTTIGSFLSLKLAPVAESGNWRDPVIKLSETLKTLPEDLFPPQHLRNALKRNRADIDMSAADVAAVIEWHHDPATPEDELIAADKAKVLSECLSSLAPRDERVLRQRFGLDCEAKGLAEVGEEMGIGKERVRQIEARALRLLRHQSRAEKLELAGWH